MTFTDADRVKLSEIATRLPNWAHNADQAKQDADFLLSCIDQRGAQLDDAMKHMQFSDANFALFRCESQALNAGRSAIQKYWMKRFDTSIGKA